MVNKIVSVDDTGLFPSRVMTALKNLFLLKTNATPSGIGAEPTGLSSVTQSSLALTYVAIRGAWAAGIAFPKNSLVIQAGVVYLSLVDVPARSVFTASDWQSFAGTAAPPQVTVTDNGDGTFAITGVDVTDNGDGTFTSTGTVTDNGDGTFVLAA